MVIFLQKLCTWLAWRFFEKKAQKGLDDSSTVFALDALEGEELDCL